MKKKRSNLENKKHALASLNRKKYIELKHCWYIFEYCVISETEINILKNIKSNNIYQQVHHIGRISNG